MSIVVYWLDQGRRCPPPMYKSFDKDELTDALNFSEELRKAGYRHVTISCEADGNVGKPGVDSVKDGKTPDGQPYDWVKRR